MARLKLLCLAVLGFWMLAGLQAVASASEDQPRDAQGGRGERAGHPTEASTDSRHMGISCDDSRHHW